MSWNWALNSTTMAMVMGASLLVLNVAIFWGTLSSSTRKFSRGMLGMKCPLLSSTATSSCTVVTSLRKVGDPSGMSLPLVLNWEGILGCGGGASGTLGALVVVGASAGTSFFLGRAMVS